jgi:hypothetical protein
VGEGAFVFNAGTTPLTLTFVGEVAQGNLSNPLPLGFSIKANQVPQAIKPDDAGLPGTAGDRFFRYNKAQAKYDGSLFSSAFNAWSPALPVIDVGEAFFLFRATSAGTWNRTFSVNN